MGDLSGQLCAAVAECAAAAKPVYVTGGGSKRDRVGRACSAAPLEVAGHRGVIDYQPEELVLTARAGTPIAELETLLAEHGQFLPFEPPRLEGCATLGGTLACNLSGPGRPWFGSARDAILGVSLINGRGQLLRFGGKVVKNVAGYDVSRLQAGALGVLGIMTDISLKVLPRPEHSLTLRFEADAAEAQRLMLARAREPKPLSGACWFDGGLYLRLSGAGSAVKHTAGLWGGDICNEEDTPWEALREYALPFFAGDEPTWRISTATTEALPSTPRMLLDWGGALRWVRGDLQDQPAAGTTLFSGGDRDSEVRGVTNPVEQRLQQRLKASFDPAGVLNPGRLYSWM